MAIYLRIKRSNTDCPSKICETQNLIKRPKADLPVQFKYIGSQTNSDSSLTDKINEVYTSDKSCKIICNTSDAIVVDENHSVKCQIKVNNLKRPALTAGVFDEFNNLHIDSSNMVIGPRPPKVFKIIELTPESTIPISSSKLSINDSEVIDQSNYVYDIYKMISSQSNCLLPEETIWCSTEDLVNNDALIKNANNYIYDEYNWSSNDDYTVDDDDDDSNSESNWRNDYPDEKESSYSSDDSSSCRDSDFY
uniref:Probable RNA polymerase II nuclear localization protein SLC7A6OS n=1 Tax=Schistosoma japonicum TaxID=6182 RepID=Q5DAK3_SCHJA|nr:SJCHGC01535 protein [Schistosoma japonicum]